MPEDLDLFDLFNQYFELVVADDDALRQRVYELRYQVYCLETGFERQEDCQSIVGPDGQPVWLETDAYDVRSAHCLVRHKRTGQYAATTRLVLPVSDDPLSQYPIEEHCELSEPVTDLERRRALGEVSRFAVSRDFKRRQGEAGTVTGISEQNEQTIHPDERRFLPHLTVGLISGLLMLSRLNSVEHWYAVMEPAFIRLLQRFGIFFIQIGPDVDYHGRRRPSVICVESMLKTMREVNPTVWDLVTQVGKLA